MTASLFPFLHLSLRVVRVLAFVALSPIYFIGWVLLACLEDDDDEWLEGWPLEVRLLSGFAAPLVLVAVLIGFGVVLLWEETGGRRG